MLTLFLMLEFENTLTGIKVQMVELVTHNYTMRREDGEIIITDEFGIDWVQSWEVPLGFRS